MIEKSISKKYIIYVLSQYLIKSLTFTKHPSIAFKTSTSLKNYFLNEHKIDIMERRGYL